jgi:hypothetical protein
MVKTRRMQQAADALPLSNSGPTAATLTIVTVAKPVANQKKRGKHQQAASEMPPPKIVKPLPVYPAAEEPSDEPPIPSIPALVSPILASGACPPTRRNTRSSVTKAKVIEAGQVERINIPEPECAIDIADPPVYQEVIHVKHSNRENKGDKKLRAAAKVFSVIPDSDYAMMSEHEDLEIDDMSSDGSEIAGVLGVDDPPMIVKEEEEVVKGKYQSSFLTPLKLVLLELIYSDRLHYRLRS